MNENEEKKYVAFFYKVEEGKMIVIGTVFFKTIEEGRHFQRRINKVNKNHEYVIYCGRPVEREKVGL